MCMDYAHFRTRATHTTSSIADAAASERKPMCVLNEAFRNMQHDPAAFGEFCTSVKRHALSIAHF
jgi:hypothetical protein